MAVAFNAAGGGSSTTAATTISWSHTAAGGNDCVVLVGVSINSAFTPPVVTYGGVTMPILAGFSSPQTYVYALFNPATGAQTVLVTAASGRITGNSVSYTGVLCIGGPKTLGGSGTAVSSAQPTVASVGRAVVAFYSVVSGIASNISALTGNSRYNLGATSTRQGLAISDVLNPASSSQTMSATLSGSQSWIETTVELVPTGDTAHEAVKIQRGLIYNQTTGTSTTLGTSLTSVLPVSGASTVAVVMVDISVSTNNADTTCAVTYGGVAMTQIGLQLVGSTTSRLAVGIYALANPATGSQTVTVTTGGAGTKTAVAAACIVLYDASSPPTQYQGSNTVISPTYNTGATQAIGSFYTAVVGASQTTIFIPQTAPPTTWMSQASSVGGFGDSILSVGAPIYAAADFPLALSFDAAATSAWMAAVFPVYVTAPAGNTGAFFAMF